MTGSDKQDLRVRTTAYALRIIRLYGSLPKTTEAQVIGRQLLRGGTPVGAHYREATGARSRAEFISKIEGAFQELDESSYWLELLGLSGIVSKQLLADLCTETDELIAVFTTSAMTAKRQMNVVR